MILRQIFSTVLGMSLFLPVSVFAQSALADNVGMPGRGGDGHCPIKGLVTDPDCAREGAQYRGSGRVDGNEQAKSRDRKSTRLNSSHVSESRMPSSA